MVRAAMNAIISLFVSERPDTSSADQNSNSEDKDLSLLWSALYIQELTAVRIAWFFYTRELNHLGDVSNWKLNLFFQY